MRRRLDAEIRVRNDGQTRHGFSRRSRSLSAETSRRLEAPLVQQRLGVRSPSTIQFHWRYILPVLLPYGSSGPAAATIHCCLALSRGHEPYIQAQLASQCVCKQFGSSASHSSNVSAPHSSSVSAKRLNTWSSAGSRARRLQPHPSACPGLGCRRQRVSARRTHSPRHYLFDDFISYCSGSAQ